MSQRAADRAEGQAGEKNAEAHNQLVGEEAFEIGIAEFPGLAEVGEDKKGGDEAEAAPADGLEQPERGETERSTVKHKASLP